MKLDDYYLDMNQLLNIGDREYCNTIIDFYRTLLMGTVNEKSIFNTLIKTGLLKNKNQEDRDDKISDLING
jgi:hypothetical protein